MNQGNSPQWPALGTPPANALYKLAQGSFTYKLPADSDEVRDWLHAIATLETFGWEVTRREIHAPPMELDIVARAIGKAVPALSIGVIDLAESSMHVLADKFVSELMGHLKC